MKKRKLCLLSFLAFMAFSKSNVNAQISLLKDYTHKDPATIGKFQGIDFKEGGFSSLYPIAGTNGKEFWTISDRGVNIDAASANVTGCKPTYDKIYAFPTYAPKIHRIRVEGTNIKVLQTITMKRPNGTGATGLINPTGFGSTSAELASTDTVQNCANFNTKTAAKDVWGIDSEGLVVDKEGNFWIAEEGGPTIWKLNKNGVVVKRYTPYANVPGAEKEDIAIDTVYKYRKNNRGFEGLAMTPNGKLYAIIQSPILYPTKTIGESSRIHRILEIDPKTDQMRMLAYLNDGIIGTSGANQIRLRDWKIGDMAAINDTEFLVIEQALRGLTDRKFVYKINIAKATPVNSGLYNGSTLEALKDSTGLANNSIIPVEKTLFMDMLANNWPSNFEKAEGIALINDSTIAFVNDNDFGQYSPLENGVAAANNMESHLFVYGLSGTNKITGLEQPTPSNLGGFTGPSTLHTPYLQPTKQDVKFTSILTAGDSIGSYKMAGLADGTGAFDNGDGTFTFLIGHEIVNTAGVARAHGQKGAFVSKWKINKNDLSVVSGSDLIQNVKLWDGTTYKTYNVKDTSSSAAMSRFCSADLPEVSAFYNAKTGLGTQARIFMNGEESGAEGRAFAHVVTGSEAGTTYELPKMGNYSFENSVANPFTGDKTVVVGTDDATPGQVYVYIGTKTNTGNEIEKAGLTNGKLFGVAVTGLTTEASTGIPAANTAFTLADLGNVENLTGATLNTNSNNAGVTNFLRPEDGAWDPSNPNDFYFVTTNSFTNPSRLWKLRFSDLTKPELGGTITAVLDGTEGPKMMDNLTIDNAGHILIQEDPGNQSYLAKIWEYNTQKDSITQIAVHDDTRFVTGSANFLTQDEEASGIIDVQSILGKGMFLLVDQAHYKQSTEIVEGGQILAMFNPSTADNVTEIDVTGNDQTIANNDATPSVIDNTSFGSIAINKEVTKSFKIKNLGKGDLKINDFYLGGQDKNAFTLVNDYKSQIVVAPNSSYTVDVKFKATATGTKTAELNVLTNDFDEKNYMFKIAATGNDQTQGISSSQTPYLLPSKQGVKFTSILTAGDSIGSYKMSGLADGTGAFDNGDGTFTFLIGHEIVNTAGVARAHGQKGAFVSKWKINKSDLSVVSGSDLIQNVKLWDGTTYKTYNVKDTSSSAAMSRFCSADLPEVSAFYNAKTGLGTQARIFMNGEESGAEGRAFAHVVTGSEAGTTYELPKMGNYSFENSVANPFTGDKTVVVGTDDATPGQVYVYIGTKTNTGNEIEKAGLTNGKLFGVAVTGLTTEASTSIPAANTAFTLADLGNVENLTGATLNTNSNNTGVTNFLRPEDGAWDPSNPNDFYFVTTNSFTNPSRLWKLRFSDLTKPELGGTITAVLDGTEGPKMMDNLTIDNAGHILIQEDPGNQSYLAKIWEYNTQTDNITQIAVHDDTRFVTGSANFLTQDEEASGIIDVQSILGKGMFLLVDQAHYKQSTEIVEGGQILAMFNPSTADSAVVITKQPNVNYEVCENGTVSIAIEAKHATKYIWQAGKNGSYTDVVDNSNFLGATTPTLSISNASKLLNGLSYRCLVSRNTGIAETSILTTLTVNQSSTSTTSKEACGSYDWNGKNYTQSGEYTFTTKNKVGCDSIATLKLKINQGVTSTETKTACGALTWHGKSYTQSGNFVDTLKTTAGCDSIVTLNLTINKEVTSTETKTACGEFTWHGKTYTQSGNFVDSLKTTAGCDSIVTLNLTINKGVTSTETKTACEALTWHGKKYTQSGNFVDSLKTTAGCDSIVTLNLTINKGVTSTETKTACGALTWHGKSYTQSGNFVDTLKTTAGCDSIITLNLTINKEVTSTETKTACGALTWHGKSYTQSGNFVDTLKTTAGCDSIVTLNLTINKEVTSTETKTACGEFTWHGKTYTQSGNFVDSLKTTAGCDSIITLNLTIRKGVTSTETKTACGEFTWHGKTYTQSGNFVDSLKTTAGCDSIVTLNLTINKGVTSTETKTACGALTWHGKSYTQSGNFVDTLKTTAGCDSIVTLNLTINKEVTSTETKTACGALTWNGKSYTQSGNFVDTLKTTAGCDSIVTLNLTINKEVTSTETKTACGALTWHGKSYTQSGNFVDTLKTTAGCDSIVTLNLTINKGVTSTETKTACGALTWHGKLYRQSGNFVDTLKTTAGCDSIVTLNLTINQGVTSTETKTSCGEFTWHGKTYTQSGNFVDTLKTKAGCDSIVTLKLNVTSVNDSIKFVNQTLSVSQQNAVYSWFNCETKKVIDNETNQTFTPSANGTYAAIINVKSCIDTTACIAISKVGVDELDASQVQIFPNPAHDHITVQLDSDAKDVNYTLIDASGKVVTSGASENNGTINIPVHNYSEGMYVLQVTLNQNVHNYKVSIKH